MNKVSISALSIIAGSWLLFSACAHSLVKVIERNPTGGVISYSQPSWFSGDADASTLRKQFQDAATELCGSSSWIVTKEVIPMPEVTSAVRNAASGDAKGALFSGSNNYQRDRANRDAALNQKVEVEYGSPFQTGNRAHVKCEKRGK